MKPILAVALGLLTATTASFAGDIQKNVASPAPEDSWRFKLMVPGWLPGIDGDAGINGLTSQIDLDPGDVFRHYDIAVSLRAEAEKGRFGIIGGLLYTSLSDGVGSETVIQKLDIQVDQTIAELALRWRVIESPRGSLDLLGGVRYVNLFQQAVTQPNSEAIEKASSRLVDAVGEQLRSTLSSSRLQGLIDGTLATRLGGFDPGRPSTLPIGPLGGRLGSKLREQVARIVEARRGALAAAVKQTQESVGARRVQAQARLDDLKKHLSKKIARALESRLDTRLARTDDWWDPFIGLRARYNFNDQFYATVRGDIGGFGVGSDLTWQTEGALGCQLTRHLFTELGYRALGIDYDSNGLVYDVVMHGPQVTVGFEF